jgi:hypothetical protein
MTNRDKRLTDYVKALAAAFGNKGKSLFISRRVVMERHAFNNCNCFLFQASRSFVEWSAATHQIRGLFIATISLIDRSIANLSNTAIAR